MKTEKVILYFPTPAGIRSIKLTTDEQQRAELIEAMQAFHQGTGPKVCCFQAIDEQQHERKRIAVNFEHMLAIT